MLVLGGGGGGVGPVVVGVLVEDMSIGVHWWIGRVHGIKFLVIGKRHWVVGKVSRELRVKSHLVLCTLACRILENGRKNKKV